MVVLYLSSFLFVFRLLQQQQQQQQTKQQAEHIGGRLPRTEIVKHYSAMVATALGEARARHEEQRIQVQTSSKQAGERSIKPLVKRIGDAGKKRQTGKRKKRQRKEENKGRATPITAKKAKTVGKKHPRKKAAGGKPKQIMQKLRHSRAKE